MKYIVDLPENTVWVDVTKSSIKNGLITFTSNIKPISELTPYTELDKEEIEDNVWEFASKLMNMHSDVAEDIYWSMNGGKGIGVAAEMSYHEAKAKYNEWLKQKDDAAKQKVITLADEIGIHNLYSLVKEIRGE